MLTGNILTPAGWRLGRIKLDAGRIAALDLAQPGPVDPARNDAPYILPGFIDLHVHGGGGADTMEGGAAAVTMARLHARFGTTSLLATTMTAPRHPLRAVLVELGALAHERPAGAARMLGVHLEGPYISRRSSARNPPRPSSRCSTRCSTT